jgi:hypothetical protein
VIPSTLIFVLLSIVLLVLSIHTSHLNSEDMITLTYRKVTVCSELVGSVFDFFHKKRGTFFIQYVPYLMWSIGKFRKYSTHSFPRYPFWLTGANKPIVRKHILKYQKSETKFLHVYLDILCSRTNFWKERIFFVSRIKKIVYEYMTIYETYFCLFTDAT